MKIQVRWNRARVCLGRTFVGLASTAICAGLAGCGSPKGAAQNQSFFTSGSREADQRASQRMAQHEQLAGSAGGSAEKDKDDSGQAEAKKTLYQRLGGERGITAIVEDFLPRAMEDPRVNWTRRGVVQAGLFHKHQETAWDTTTNEVTNTKKHFIQFLSLATGGPVHYDGKEMKEVHKDMHIANPEFDAAVGDLKATLDKLQVPNTEQKELLAIVESTRAQIVTER